MSYDQPDLDDMSREQLMATIAEQEKLLALRWQEINRLIKLNAEYRSTIQKLERLMFKSSDESENPA